MKKYFPSVASIIRSMQHGRTLRRTMTLSRQTSRTQTFRGGGEIGGTPIFGQTWDRLMATKGDLIEIVPGSTGIGTAEYRLTERGQKIKFDGSGQEMPDDWTPPPPKARPWKHPRVYLAPGINRVFVVETESDHSAMPGLYDANSGEPLIQIPTPEMSQTTIQAWLKGHRDKKDADPENKRLALYETFAEVIQTATDERWSKVKLTRDWEGWFTHFPGDEVSTFGIKQGNRWYVEDAFNMSLESVVESIWLSLAQGDANDGIFNADKDTASAANRRLAIARKQAGKDVSRRTTWHFKLKIELFMREDSPVCWQVLELSADKGIHLGGLQVSLPANETAQEGA